MQWAFGAFETVRFFDAGETVAQAEVWLGATPSVPLVVAEPAQMLAPQGLRGEMTARVVYDGPVAAPIAAGQQVGLLLVEAPGMDAAEFPLVAGADVAEGGFGVRVQAAGRAALERAVGLLPAGAD